MTILNFGSLNIDHVYTVEHFVRPGETLSSSQYRQFAGGKGFNQSIALAQAGARLCHAGQVGQEGVWLRDRLARVGVDVTHIGVVEEATGHAIIQVDEEGENAIVLFGGANQSITPATAQRVFADFGPGDLLLLQNEISAMAEILELAGARGLRVIFNPAPMTARVLEYPLQQVDTFIINRVEGQGLTGESQPNQIVDALRTRFPRAAVVLTLGAQGVLYADPEQTLALPAFPVQVADTTAAGDTFIGFFLAAQGAGHAIPDALGLATRAAALCVTRPGAADSIPTLAEVGKARMGDDILFNM